MSKMRLKVFSLWLKKRGVTFEYEPKDARSFEDLV